MSESGGGEPPTFVPELAGLLLSEETVSGLLDTIVHLASSVVSGVDGASTSLVVSDGQHLETANASSEAVRAVDEAQYQLGEGPCVEAIRTGEETVVSLEAVPRWPGFSARAAGAGVRSVLSLPLRARERTLGALNLYSMHADLSCAEGSTVEVARALAGQASVVLANAAALMSAELTNRHLQEALASRDLIGQAKGILMVRHGIGGEKAFALLRRESQRGGRKLRDVAAEIVATQRPPRDRP